MPLSNYLASSRLSQPGVCTSSTRPALPYQGQVIYETDTAKTLVWNGSAWVFLSTGTTSGVGMTQVTSGSFTNITGNSALSLGFTTDFPHYRLIMNWTQATAAAWMNCQVRNASQTIISSATYDNQRFDYYGSGTVAAGSLGDNQWLYLGYNYLVGFPSALTADFINATVAVPTYMQSRGTTKRTGAGNYLYVIEKHGLQTDSIVVGGIVVYPDAGASTGTYSLYGYR